MPRCKMNKTCQYIRLMLAVLMGLVGIPMMAQQDIGCEYFIGSDPGLGKAIHVNATIDGEGNMRFSIPDTQLSDGYNLVGIRTYHKTEQGCYFSPTVLSYTVKASSDQVNRIEYFWDEDPGFGKGTVMEYEAGKEVTVSKKIPTEGLAPGNHKLGIRAAGIEGWGPTVLYDVAVSGPDQTVNRIEYFWDEDPGIGMGTVMEYEAGEEVTVSKKIPTEGLTPGYHKLGIRAAGDYGWGPTFVNNVLVSKNGLINNVEYFWDKDPGFGMGTPLAITPGEEIDLEEDIPTDGLPPGNHKLGVRTRGESGWSPTTWHEVILRENAEIECAEYFWGTDPGYGKGTPIAITRGEEVTLDDFEIPTDENIHGDAVLGIRFFGAAGWSPTLSYMIMVDAEGNYTLDSTAPTDFESRNFQSLADMMADFADRGVGGEVTITAKNSNTEYAMDLAAEGAMEKMTVMANQLEERNHWIAFTATAGSANTIAVTTADEEVETFATVMKFFAHTTLENITLTINGKQYQFNALKNRKEEICSGEEAAGVDFGNIADGISVNWTAAPHDKTILSGYVTEGTGNLMPGIIVNTGTKLDSLAYTVMLDNADGEHLYAYTYFVYTHSMMAGRQFSGISPKQGATLDPTKTTLSWTPMDDCRGYRLNVTSKEVNDETDATLSSETIELTEPKHELVLKPGNVYTWNVTAIGHCDEVNSSDMTFTVRRLPDLMVTAVNVPEYAEAGNTLTVTATVANNGESTTVKGAWQDKLYYVTDSEDFAAAKEATVVSHRGDIASGESYDVTFVMTVPEQDSGTLRLFVVADDGNKEMELNEDNNRMMSESVTLKPFFVNTADLAALRKLYADFGGEEWNGTKWDISSELIKTGNWSGVTFDTEGRVTAINLTARGLAGTLTADNAPQFAVLTSLNLSRNSISGDASLIAGEGMPMLKTFDLSYNKIDALTKALPSGITSLNLGYQYRIYNSSNLPDFDSKESQRLSIGGTMAITHTTLDTYSHDSQDWSVRCNYAIYSRDLKTKYGSFIYDSEQDAYTFSIINANTQIAQDEDVVLIVSSGIAKGTASPALIHYEMGDANIDAQVDVLDAQHTLNYIMGTQKGNFNFAAADTYQSGNINVQDVVATVNLFIETEESLARTRVAMARARETESQEHNTLGIMDGELWLDAGTDIAALDITLSGVSGNEVKFALSTMKYQVIKHETTDGVRVVILSPTGDVLSGNLKLFRLSRNDAKVVNVVAASPSAEYVNVDIGRPTGVSGIEKEDDNNGIYDLNGRKLNTPSDGVNIKNGKKILNKNR